MKNVEIRRLFLLLFFALAVWQISAENKGIQVTGKVVDETGEELPGVNVVDKKNGTGTTTDVDGFFRISIEEGNELLFSCIGFEPQTISVNSGESLTIVLQEKRFFLNEVVITSLNIPREKKSLGYSTQEISSETLQSNPETNIVNALSGRLAGVRTTNSQGDMSSSRIVIRGETSITGNNEPLFIVDGIPVDNSQLNKGGASRDFKNAIADLNPRDIETISVLKGPNAAALYGSRAAHGVILITTKTGKGKKGVGVSVNSGITFSKIATLASFQDVFGQGAGGEFYYVDGKGGGINDAVDYSWGPKMEGQLLPQFYSNGEAVPFVAHPNNVKDFFETGITYDNGVSISSSEEKYDFRLSVNHQDQRGTVPNTQLKKTNFSINTNYQLTNRLKVGVIANYIVTDAPNLPATAGGDTREASVMQQFLYFGRQVDLAELKKDWTRNWNDSYYSNPYWRANYNTVEQNRNRFMGNVHVDYEIVKDFHFKFRTGTDYYTDKRKYKIKTGTSASPDGSYTEDTHIVSENNTEALLTYTKSLTSKLNFDVLAGFNVQNQKYENNYQKATKLATPDLFTLSNSKEALESSNNFNRKRVYSQFASAQFGYGGYAYVNVTARNDISSTLPRDNRSYFYPSVNVSFIPTEFFGWKNNVLNYLKLRGGWSEVGNDADPYLLGTTYDIQTAFEGNPILTSSTDKNNPDLKPERTRSTEIGAEGRLFNSRVYFDISLYNTNSVDQILRVPTSSASGYKTQLINAGKLNNKGIEIQFGFTPVETNSFSWNVDVNYAANRSKVVELDKEGLLDSYILGAASYGTLQVLATVGQPYGTLYGTVYKRNDEGKIIIDNTGMPVVDQTNNEIFGRFTPDWTGGISNTFRYKNLELSFLIDASIGGKIHSDTNELGDRSGVLKETLFGRSAEYGGITYNYYYDGNNRVIIQEGQSAPAGTQIHSRDDGMIIEGVTEDGLPNTTITTAETYYREYLVKERHVYDASYIKLREIKLVYSFKKELIKKIGLEGASISAIARNVAILHKNAPNIDPEVSTGTGNGQGLEKRSLPSTRSFGFNINLTF